jgi:hypothetical protein
MTSLEQTLASVLDAIELARKAGNSRMLRAFLDRKRAICGALAAPEQSWLEPPAQVLDHCTAPEQKQSARAHALRIGNV